MWLAWLLAAQLLILPRLVVAQAVVVLYDDPNEPIVFIPPPGAFACSLWERNGRAITSMHPVEYATCATVRRPAQHGVWVTVRCFGHGVWSPPALGVDGRPVDIYIP